MGAQQDFSVGEHDWHSREYVDWWVRRDDGREAERRERLSAMLSHAPFAKDAEIAVVDIGGGYGIVTEMVLQAFPRARVTVQDYSQPMLEEAKRRLAPTADRVGFVLADLRDPAWVKRVGGPFDLAVSAIAIHNLRELPAIDGCYRGIARILKPGALFLDYDLFFDKIGGVEGHRAMLRESGFARVDCLFRHPPAAALAAYMS
jgi:ubiquinone/menaquinone biosynthesis C-methylase UbiE